MSGNHPQVTVKKLAGQFEEHTGHLTKEQLYAALFDHAVFSNMEPAEQAVFKDFLTNTLKNAPSSMTTHVYEIAIGDAFTLFGKEKTCAITVEELFEARDHLTKEEIATKAEAFLKITTTEEDHMKAIPSNAAAQAEGYSIPAVNYK